MARVLEQLVEAPRACSYLPLETASLDVRILVDVSSEELEAMLVRGWRRFGPQYFRPACPNCSACVSTRIPTSTFAPSKSQRRARRACSTLRTVLGRPRVDRERLDLFHRWHAFREVARSWPEQTVDAKSYQIQFAFPHPAARELAYYEDRGGETRLVGVALCDETANTWSAAYFYYDPGWARRSIGIANIVLQIEVARARGLPHVYLGYRIDECASMKYKARFQPQERLVGSPSMDELPVWEPRV